MNTEVKDAIVIDFQTREIAIVNNQGWKTFITPSQLEELLEELPKDTKINIV